MTRTETFALCAVVILWLLTVSLHAQSEQSAGQAFAAKDYAGYVQAIATEWTNGQGQLAVPFPKLTMAAIALEKTAGWDGAAGTQATALLEKAPGAGKQFAALRALLTGETGPVCALYREPGLGPDFPNGSAASKLCREHGFPLAADVLLAHTPDLSAERVVAWVHIPADKRGPVDDYMRTRYPPRGMNRRSLVQIALGLAKRPPAGSDLSAQTFAEFAVWLGSESEQINQDTVRDLLDNRANGVAILVANTLLARKSADAFLACNTGDMFMRSREPAAALACFQAGMAHVPEPMASYVRRAYLEALPQLAKTLPDLSADRYALRTDPRPLLAAEACLVADHLPEAAEKYRAIVMNAATPTATRVAAWGGWLQADPAAALDAVGPLCDAIAAQPEADRGVEVAWMSRVIAEMLPHNLPPDPGNFERPYKPYHARPFTDVPHWEAAFAACMDRLLALDATACLKDDRTYNYTTLRGTFALIYALAGQTEKMTDIVQRPVTYLIPPPPGGGWTNYDGSPMPDGDKPRPVTKPSLDEASALMTWVSVTMTRLALERTKGHPEAALPTPVNTRYITQVAQQISAGTEAPDALVSVLGAQYYTATRALNPFTPFGPGNQPPPTREIVMADYARVDAAVRQALTRDAAARCLQALIDTGLQPALTHTANPQLMDANFDLTIFAIDRYQTAGGDPGHFRTMMRNLVLALEHTPYYNTKPYAAKLREKYGVK